MDLKLRGQDNGNYICKKMSPNQLKINRMFLFIFLLLAIFVSDTVNNTIQIPFSLHR